VVELLKEYLIDWHTLTEIIDYLNYKKSDGRMIRLAFAKYNEDSEITDPFICHSIKGYKITNNDEEIKKSVYDDIKRINKTARRVRKALYKVNHSTNVNIFEYLDI
jgi:hypothetical protein